MNNAIIIQQVYPGMGFEPLLELTRKRHEAYCAKWKMDYQAVIDNVLDHDPQLGAYPKIKLIKDAMLHGYEFIIWIDADAMIADLEIDLRQAVEVDKIGVCWQRIPQLHHWNVGVLYVHNSADTYTFIDEWLKSYPPPKDGWNEQGVFNRMGMKSKTVVTVSDKWNATLNYSMVPDAVVLGFHGYGGASERLQAMKTTLEKLDNPPGKMCKHGHYGACVECGTDKPPTLKSLEAREGMR